MHEVRGKADGGHRSAAERDAVSGRGMDDHFNAVDTPLFINRKFTHSTTLIDPEGLNVIRFGSIL